MNTHGVVPHIKEILGKMLPLLTIIKLEGVKQAFAYGMHFKPLFLNCIAVMFLIYSMKIAFTAI